MSNDNVVAFRPRHKKPIIDLPTNQAPQSVIDFIGEVYLWAQSQGVDTDTLDFKYEAATVMTVLQGMLHKVKND